MLCTLVSSLCCAVILFLLNWILRLITVFSTGWVLCYLLSEVTVNSKVKAFPCKKVLLVYAWRHGGHVGDQEQKHFSSLGTKLYFHVNFRKIKFIVTDHQLGRRVTRFGPRITLKGEIKGEFFRREGERGGHYENSHCSCSTAWKPPERNWTEKKRILP